MKRIALSLLLVVGTTSLASAQRPAEGDPFFDPLTMDRHTPVSTFGVDVGYEAWDEAPGTDLTVMSLTLGGHYVTEKGVGGYLVIPLSYIDIRFPLFGIEDSKLALGNIEAGAMYSKWVGRNTALVLHGGIALPTANDNDAGLYQHYAAFTRLGDLVQRWPDSSWLRLGVSPMGRAGIAFWRADIGIDLALDEDRVPQISPIFHINFGGGVDLGSVQLLGELVTAIIDPDDNAIDETGSTLALGARFAAGSLRPGVALLLPVGLDDYDEFDFALVLSLTGRMPTR